MIEHRYLLIVIPGDRPTYRARCSCGWMSRDAFSTAGLASSAQTQHRDDQANGGAQ